MIDSLKRTYRMIKPYFSNSTFRGMLFMAFSRTFIICGIGTLSVPAMFLFAYNNAADGNFAMLCAGCMIFLVYIVWLLWADKSQLISYNRRFFLSEVAMQKDYLHKLVGLGEEFFEKKYGVSKAASLLDEGVDEVMMRFQDFVTIVFKLLASVCVIAWMLYISSWYLVVLLLGVIVADFILTDRMGRKISRCEDDRFQALAGLRGSRRVFTDHTEVYAMSGLGGYWKKRIQGQLEDVYQCQKRIAGLQNGINALMSGLDLAVYIMTVLYGLRAAESLLSPLVIIMAYEMVKDIVTDFLNAVLRIQQKVYAINEFEEINANTQTQETVYAGEFTLSHVNLRARGRVLLSDVNMTVPRRSKVLIVGNNGAGKTVLLKILAGIYRDGDESPELTGEVQREKSVYAPVEKGFFPVSVYDNIGLCCEKEVGKSRLEEEIRDLLKRELALDEEYENYENYFSLGQMDVFSFLRAVYSDGEALILDEPFAHVDKELRKKLWSRMMELEKTVIVVDHDYREEAVGYNPLTIWMDAGRVRAFGEYNSLYEENMDFRKWVESFDCSSESCMLE